MIGEAANRKAGGHLQLAWLAWTWWEVSVHPVLQFSKERHIMDGTPERLRKELEEELLLSSEDLRSHAWYHGRIPRQVPASSPPAHARLFSDDAQIDDPVGSRIKATWE